MLIFLASSPLFRAQLNKIRDVLSRKLKKPVSYIDTYIMWGERARNKIFRSGIMKVQEKTLAAANFTSATTKATGERESERERSRYYTKRSSLRSRASEYKRERRPWTLSLSLSTAREKLYGQIKWAREMCRNASSWPSRLPPRERESIVCGLRYVME